MENNNNTDSNRMTNDDLLRYAVGALIVLAFISILGLYLFLFSSGVFKGGANSAAVFQATEQTPEVTDRIVTLQKELDAANKKAADAIATSKNIYANQSYLGTNASATTAPAPSLLKIKTFQADQANVSSGSVVTFNYSASNLQNGVSYRILIECPSGVTATYATGANLCRTNIGQALAIDNTGSYSVNFTNTSADSQTSIVVLLAYDMTNNNIVLRDSKVLTVTVRPNGYTGYVASTQPVTLHRTPATATAPATISFIATLNNLKTCIPTSWNFGDGHTTAVDAVCPSANGYAYGNGINTRQISENHVYNDAGTYTITFTAGEDSVTATVYIAGNTTYTYTAPVVQQPYNYNYNQYQYPYNYNYQQPIYNYVPQPYYVNIPNPQPVYVYPDPVNTVPSAPALSAVVRTDMSGVTNLSWNSVGSNVYYRIFRSTISGEAVNSNPQACTLASNHSCVIVSGTNDATYSLQGVDTQYDHATTYYYRVKAYNSTGGSGFSNEVISRPSTTVVNPILDPAITNFTIGGGTNPTVSSGQVAPLSYGGTNVSAFGIIVSCPAGVSMPDQNGGANLCATAQTTPYIVSNSGSASIMLVNLSTAPQSVSVTLVALRTNGSIATSVSRTVVVRPRAGANNNNNPSSCSNGWTGVHGAFIGNGDTRFICNNGTWVTTAIVNSQNVGTWGFSPTQVAPCTIQAGKYSPAVNAGFIPLVNGAVPSSCGAVVADPAITNFTVNGQTSSTVNSGQTSAISYGGSYVSSYKLLIQCPANVSAPEQSTGANLCRTNNSNAIVVSNSGNYSLMLVNLSGDYQTVALTILGLRTDGSVGSSVTRYVTVRNQAGL